MRDKKNVILVEKLRSLILFCFNCYAVLNRSESESESRRQRGIKRVSSGIGGRNTAVIHPRQEGRKKQSNKSGIMMD